MGERHVLGRELTSWSAPRLRLTVPGLPDESHGVIERQAVRAVVRGDGSLLLIHSRKAGDLKFPGGGLEPGESLVDALQREVREECGREVTEVGEVCLVVDERRPALAPGWELHMQSVYVVCAVGPVEHGLCLDHYERELRFQPEWVAPLVAIETNRRVLQAAGAAPWVLRELRVLEWLDQHWSESTGLG